MQSKNFNFRAFLSQIGRNRSIPSSTTELNVPLGHLKIRFQMTGRLTIQERRQIGLVIYRQLRPLFNHVDFHLIRHIDSDHLNELRDNRTRICLRRGLELNTIEKRAGFLIRMKRLELGWTQVHCAKQLGLDRGHLSKLERGNCRMLPATRSKIRNVLKIDLDD